MSGKQLLRCISRLALSALLLGTAPAGADIFGSDTAVLMQILSNAIKQLYELQQIVGTGRDPLGLLRDINQGINDSLRVVDSISPYVDPGLYKDLRKISDALRHLETIYGEAAQSTEAPVQRDTDQVIAESINMSNNLYDYAKDLDQIAERIKNYSHDVSPGGAAKLTAQTLAVIVQVMNQQMRTQGQILKLQAQSLAVQNKRGKDETRAYLEQTDTLRQALKSTEPKFEFPQF